MKPHNPLEGERPELSFNLHDGSEEQISIVVVTKDSPEYLNICLQSIAVNSINSNYELIVVDNGSGQDTQDFLNEISEEVKVVKNPKNLYWSEAANRGAAVASERSKYIVFMHSDVVILHKGWLDLLINASESHKSGLIGVELKQYVMQEQYVTFVQEWLVMYTRECWRNIGPFPEELPQIGHSFYMTLKAQKEGYKPQIMKNPIAHHYGIFGLNINEYERLAEQAMVTLPKLLSAVQTRAV